MFVVRYVPGMVAVVTFADALFTTLKYVLSVLCSTSNDVSELLLSVQLSTTSVSVIEIICKSPGGFSVRSCCSGTKSTGVSLRHELVEITKRQQKRYRTYFENCILVIPILF